ncbi:MAG: hypothetical protein AAGC55_12860, partial [Myxococcota bacterium]
MSFAKTPTQLRDGSKTVTRRPGWKFLRVGDVVLAVEKARGVPAAERVVFGQCLIVDVRREPLRVISADDVIAEGFPDKTADVFVEMFCKMYSGITPDSEVARIEFEFRRPGQRWSGPALARVFQHLLPSEAEAVEQPEAAQVAIDRAIERGNWLAEHSWKATSGGRVKQDDVDGGRMRIMYGSESTEALVEIPGPLMATPITLREMIDALGAAAEDL